MLSLYTLFLPACKDPEELGLEVQPTADQLLVIQADTATLITTTVKEDSLTGSFLIYQLLGSYTDPVFGRSDAGFYTKVMLGLSPTLGSSTDILIADSLILSMAYAGYYGDTNTTQTLHVYRMNEDMYDSTYYTNKTFSVDAFNDLSDNFRFKPQPNNGSALRIPLSKALASELVSLNGQSAYSDNNSWVKYFKGLYLKTDPEFGYGRGAISYFNLYNNSNSKLTLYFRKISAANDTTSKTYDFSFSTGVKVNNQQHFYAGTSVASQLLSSSSGDSVNYIQAMSGVKTKITIPYLNSFIDSGSILINKAELDITIQSGSTAGYLPPSRIFLVAINSAGVSFTLADYNNFEGLADFGGYYNSTYNTYRFNIGRHLQHILNGKISNFGFYLIIRQPTASIEANRVVIASGKNQSYPMKLHLYYTKLH